MAKKIDDRRDTGTPSLKQSGPRQPKALTRDEISQLLQIGIHAAEKLNNPYIRKEAKKHPELDSLIEAKDRFFAVAETLRKNYTENLQLASEKNALYADPVSANDIRTAANPGAHSARLRKRVTKHYGDIKRQGEKAKPTRDPTANRNLADKKEGGNER